ncbi:succinate-semialdehyde dehydrogenase [Fomitiporia mediterranea MF3/22]|uniref:succinate-semialdehyde dehydrogenase n=1 Tax=Fomitiporia mediterranea (strain MF3/22) TaxID=694068 RepID=UPI0004407CC8|nr:succinate-semialdehyde dehydrogenase [Fomitiporia mediterranea MF3/22]EJD02030.1 succinate-semialdehyde dehydrogenase [Fomitiporia mediterranea MF3/22]
MLTRVQVHRGPAFKRYFVRALSSRASRVLANLDLPTSDSAELPGVYDGVWGGSGDVFDSVCPTTGETLARIRTASPNEMQTALSKSREAFLYFRKTPAPKRGDILRQIREALARKRNELGALVSLEMGKITTEGEGEVQEFIDICDYAVGLSRMMNGNVVNSERPGHTILEVPNPLGVVTVLSAFNFPVAVYGWNLSLSMAAGNATLWKPSPSTPLCSIAVTKIIASVLEQNGIPGAVAGLVTGGKDVGEAITESRDVDMVSFTGSEETGKKVAKAVQSRHGKVLLELGGNNAAIVMPDADFSLAIPAIFFGAVGTAGQRCTSTRRLYLHRSIALPVLEKLQSLYSTLRPGDPLAPNTLLGPLHTPSALSVFDAAISAHRNAGAEILVGGSRITNLNTPLAGGNFAQPTIVRPISADPQAKTESGRLWRTETFAPILQVGVFDELEEAIEWNNSVPQGLSSSLWTRDVRAVGKWIGPEGSDAGIVNVNVGTSGAEIGAAFGGNKSTGWGRESGGDAWKQYVRWSACTINFSDAAPLAQGVTFEPAP